MIAFLSSYPIAAIHQCHPEFNFMCRRYASHGKTLLHYINTHAAGISHTAGVFHARSAFHRSRQGSISLQKTAHLPSRQMSCFFGSPGRARTYNNSVNSRVLCHWATEEYRLLEQHPSLQLSLHFRAMESGDVLLSRAVASQVPSALRGLTSVFGMGTGGSLSL